MAEQLHWQIASPIATHFRKATCAEVGCADFEHGWRIRVDSLTPDDLTAMRLSGRHFTELDVAADEHYWVFDAGQPCFRATTHQAPVGRPELYVVRDRGSVKRFDRGDQWADDCATHTNKIVDKIQEG